jgi:hypothetical protein
MKKLFSFAVTASDRGIDAAPKTTEQIASSGKPMELPELSALYPSPTRRE